MDYILQGINTTNGSLQVTESVTSALNIISGNGVLFSEMNFMERNAINYTGLETTTEANEGLQEEDFIEYHIAKYMTRYCLPIILVIGTIGNILCLLVTKRRSMRRSSVGLCLAVLAVSDMLVLFVGLSRKTAKEFSGVDVRYIHESLCKLQRFLLYFSLDFSAWILVIISVERYISVCYPFKANTMCTLSRTKKILPIVAFLVALEDAGVFWARGREYETIGNITQIRSECGYPGPDQKFYWQIVRPWNVIALYALGPFTTMIICSIRIVYQLNKARKMMSVLTNSDQSVDSVNNPNMTVKIKKQTKSQESSYKMHSMTVMSVVVAIVFLCLTTPSHFMFFLEAYWNRKDPHDAAIFTLIDAVASVLLYTNHGINFFVYCASGERFRNEFIAMVTRKKEKPMQYLSTAVPSTVKGSKESVLQ